MESLVYINNEEITDPATNLAIEEYVLRYMDPVHDYLLLYRNDPAVIVGRNQNVLEEINDSYTREKGIQVLRRLSGGGTVYHDPGNLNFSFITRYEQSRLHNFRFFNAPVVRILRSLGVPAEMNDRNDILADGRKISGSAQFSSKGRMVSHGTLLFNSKLDEIDRVLSARMKQIRSRSHKSVRSVVANISEFLREPMDIVAFRDHLLHGLLSDDLPGSRYTLSRSDRNRIHDIRDSRYRTWEWNIGRSPRFRIIRSRILNTMRVTVDLEVNKGYIEKLSFGAWETDEKAGIVETRIAFFRRIVEQLTGLKYEPDVIRKTLNTLNTRKAEDITVTIAGLSDLIYGDDE